MWHASFVSVFERLFCTVPLAAASESALTQDHRARLSAATAAAVSAQPQGNQL